jgi:hypothetical protein
MNNRIPPPNIPLVDKNGMISQDWYRFFTYTETTANTAGAGEVTGAGGLQGGGPVSGGATLSIAPNGVTDDKIRQSGHTSVIGRDGAGTGNVADVQATADNRALTREGGILAFRGTPTLDGIILGTLRLNIAPVVAAAVPSTHTVAVNINGTVARLLVAIP